MYLENMKLSGVPTPVWPQVSAIYFFAELHMATATLKNLQRLLYIDQSSCTPGARELICRYVFLATSYRASLAPSCMMCPWAPCNPYMVLLVTEFHTHAPPAVFCIPTGPGHPATRPPTRPPTDPSTHPSTHPTQSLQATAPHW